MTRKDPLDGCSETKWHYWRPSDPLYFTCELMKTEAINKKAEPVNHIQMKSIGTQNIKLNAIVDAADAHTLIRNHGNVFCMHGTKLTPRQDGAFDAEVLLVPDNGMSSVISDDVSSCWRDQN